MFAIGDVSDRMMKNNSLVGDDPLPCSVPTPASKGISLVKSSRFTKSEGFSPNEISAALPTCRRCIPSLVNLPATVRPLPLLPSRNSVGGWRLARFFVRFRRPPSPLYQCIFHLYVFKNFIAYVDIPLLQWERVAAFW